MHIDLVLTVTALILFALAALNVSSRVGLVPLGLACLTLTLLI